MNDRAEFDPFGARDRFDTGNGAADFYRLGRLAEEGIEGLQRLPYSIRLLLESLLRNCDGRVVTREDVLNLAGWNATSPAKDPTTARLACIGAARRYIGEKDAAGIAPRREAT